MDVLSAFQVKNIRKNIKQKTNLYAYAFKQTHFDTFTKTTTSTTTTTTTSTKELSSIEKIFASLSGEKKNENIHSRYYRTSGRFQSFFLRETLKSVGHPILISPRFEIATSP